MDKKSAIPRSEYPRPQFVRRDWQCLNGQWQFEIDLDDTGIDNGLLGRDLGGEITVPFSPESELSGVHRTEFLHAVWYRRQASISPEWAGQRILLHFQACDYDTTVWVDGVEVVRHRGGYTPFTADLGVAPAGGRDLNIVVRARDPHKSPMPLGKQSEKLENYGCHYTRTTGIWQTVWLEPVPTVYFRRPRITPDLGSATFTLELPLNQNKAGYLVRGTIMHDGVELTIAKGRADLSLSPRLVLQIPDGHVRPWSPDDPHLYAITIELLDDAGRVVDKLESYAGLRSIAIDRLAIKLNGKSLFQRLVLDQGFYPDGIYTAPTDAALKGDIEISQAAGFIGARLHQKVFEERFLFWADRLGYLVWGEFPDWGARLATLTADQQQQTSTFITQWLEAVERDYSHPSIIGWCPLNETSQVIGDRIAAIDDATRGMFLAAKAADLTRPVLDASGYSHRVHESDVYDSHDYDHDPNTFAQRHSHVVEAKPYVNQDKDEKTGQILPISLPYGGQPYFVSEFGGIGWNLHSAPPAANTFSYGTQPRDENEFYACFEGLCDALLNNRGHFGYCYTQLTDVFQENNGIYTFDRKPKFDMAKLKAIQSKKAAIQPVG
jgi:beta-galactosidase/beta-glucuronidase